MKEFVLRVNDELRRSLYSIMPEKLRDASLHLLMAGGKRIRPVLVFLSFKTVSRRTAIHKVIPPAVALELIHSACLVHDDIIDKALKRRGIESVHAKYGIDTALLVGDLLFSKAHSLIGRQEDRRITEVIDYTCSKLCEGEQLELEYAGKKIDEEIYFKIIEGKTASLIQACTKIGAILADGSEEQVRALSDYGYSLGMGFQIADDVLDVTGKEEEMGKPAGADAERGVSTLPGIRGVEYAKNKGKEYIERARKNLDMFEDSYGKNGLLRLADFVLERGH